MLEEAVWNFPSVSERERKVERTGWTAAAASFVCSRAFPMGRRGGGQPRPPRLLQSCILDGTPGISGSFQFFLLRHLHCNVENDCCYRE